MSFLDPVQPTVGQNGIQPKLRTQIQKWDRIRFLEMNPTGIITAD